MRKTLFIFIIILAGIFIALSLWDTSEYGLEKKVWRLQKKFTSLTHDPDMIPDQEFENLAGRYQVLLDNYPEAKMAPRLYLQMARVYLLKKDYDKARAVLNEAMDKYGAKPLVAGELLYTIGRSYEPQDKPEKALETYRSIIKEYPMTPQGLNLPLYIVEYYKRLGQPEESARQLKMATEFYRQMAKQEPHSRLELDSLRFLTTSYIAQKQWQNAVKTMTDILMKYAHPSYIDRRSLFTLIRSINVLCLQKLHDYEQPKKIFRQFIVTHPEHYLNNILEQVISGIDKLEKARQTAPPKEE